MRATVASRQYKVAARYGERGAKQIVAPLHVGCPAGIAATRHGAGQGIKPKYGIGPHPRAGTQPQGVGSVAGRAGLAVLIGEAGAERAVVLGLGGAGSG